LQKPERDAWGTGIEGMQTALALEKSINQSMLDLEKVASSHDDEHVSDCKWP